MLLQIGFLSTKESEDLQNRGRNPDASQYRGRGSGKVTGIPTRGCHESGVGNKGKAILAKEYCCLYPQ